MQSFKRKEYKTFSHETSKQGDKHLIIIKDVITLNCNKPSSSFKHHLFALSKYPLREISKNANEGVSGWSGNKTLLAAYRKKENLNGMLLKK